ncbi:S-adenosylmethionine sensor upstream of mTORC1-like [Tubulanus polymorphus]|uniref:S-adenosylmethionine sensor upstream of mTORC1-like n=1 Tax=Tubulanus polymorphus TaxID=672921 RepID=UPI003DA4B56B
MAKESHQDLAAVIKQVHADLRKSNRRNPGSADEIWNEHVKDGTKLKRYALAMLKLATTYWTKNPLTRIDWCKDYCNEYFFGDALRVALEKDAKRKQFRQRRDSPTVQSFLAGVSPHSEDVVPVLQYPFTGKVRLLDVGSCYNGFQIYEEFSVLGLDLQPAEQTDVLQADFLKLKISPRGDDSRESDLEFSEYLASLGSPVLELRAGAFDAVVFSLLLEYLPSPRQRLTCCLNARRLLSFNGLLLIVTPDSNHVNKNSAMMKSWKTALESIGFRREKYVKLEHVHAMAFRKIDDRVSVDDGVEISDEALSQLLFIPQDNNSTANDDDDDEGECGTETGEETYDFTLDEELPGFGFNEDENG